MVKKGTEMKNSWIEYRDKVFNAFYGENSALRQIIKADLAQMHKYEHLRNPKPKKYGPVKK